MKTLNSPIKSTINMKSSIYILAFSFVASTAFADHSLQYAMNSNPSIKDAVESLMVEKNVSCDTDHSIQMSAQTENGKEAWRQVTLCYSSPQAMEEATERLRKGNEFGGLYGLPATAVLDVTYSWETYYPKNIVGISLK